MEAVLARQGDLVPRSRAARLIGASPLADDARGDYSEALGELIVGERLADLGAEWIVLHSVMVDGGVDPIDHIVIGPSGVFTLTSERRTGGRVLARGATLTVDRQRTDLVTRAGAEARRVSERLRESIGGPVAVHPLIVLVGTDAIAVGDPAPLVGVIADRDLVRYLRAQPRMQSDDAVEYLALVAEERGSWRVAGVSPTRRREVFERFEALRRDVDQALVRRRMLRLWGAPFGAAAGIAGMVTAGDAFIPLWS